MKSKTYITIITIFLVLLNIAVVFGAGITLSNSRGNTYVYTFGEDNDLDIDISPSATESVIQINQDFLSLQYLPKVRTNDFTIRTEVKDITKLSDFTHAEVRGTFKVPDKLQDLYTKQYGSGNWSNIYVRTLHTLGDPSYSSENYKFWSTNEYPDTLYEGVVDSKSVPGFINDNLYTFDFSLQNNFKPQVDAIRQFQGPETRFTYPLFARGTHTLYIYHDQDSLDLTFEKFDLNWFPGEDNVEILIYNLDGNEVASGLIRDDGISVENRTSDKLFDSYTFTNELDEGLYEVRIVAGDSIISQVVGNVPLLVISDYYFLAASELYTGLLSDEKQAIASTLDEVYVGAHSLKVRAPHEEALGEIQFVTDILELDDKDEFGDFEVQEFTEGPLIIPTLDYIIEYEGFISPNKDRFFIPLPENLQTVSRFTEFEEDYIIAAKYIGANLLDEGKRLEFSVTMPLEEFDEDGTFSLQFYASNLSQLRDDIEIQNLEIEFFRSEITEPVDETTEE